MYCMWSSSCTCSKFIGSIDLASSHHQFVLKSHPRSHILYAYLIGLKLIYLRYVPYDYAYATIHVCPSIRPVYA